jgi:penicillin-binding protein 1A
MRILVAAPRGATIFDTGPDRRRRWIVLVALTALSAVLGAGLGGILRLDMPGLDGLDDAVPPEMTRLLDRDGATITSFGSEKRLLVDEGEIPEAFRLALIASEDSRFNRHAGIDFIGGFRALLNDLRLGEIDQGASTLTMQLAGNLFLDRSQRTVRRKMQEAFLALEIERRYSKPEILRMYCNRVHFGHGLYGVEAAARYFFDKPARELSLGESATLVGVLPRPAGYSPLRNPARALERRNLVLRRMVAEGYLDPAEARRLGAEPIVLAPREQEPSGQAPYFNEAVRRWLQETYGSADLYRGGLTVRTTLDPALQGMANRAVENGLRRLDRRLGWRPEDLRRVPDGVAPGAWTSPDWKRATAPGNVINGVVLAVDGLGAEVRVAERVGRLDGAAIRWTGEARPDRLLAPGDVVRVRVLEHVGEGAVRLALEQTPAVDAALVAIEPSTGAVRAMVGGFDFARSEYDRATQARRQPGSLFKPFVYAAALERGWTLADTLLDEPSVFLDRRRPVPYQPENFTRRYYGTITLRTALEDSVNIATVKLLHGVGYDPVIDVVRRLGIRSPVRAYPSLALGAFELTLLEVTSAYGAFANGGLLMAPHWIEEVADRDGRPIHDARPGATQAVSPQIAYLMNRALSGVIRRGTGRSAGAALRRTLAGKTGTTDDNTDAWFVGYSADLVVGVRVGYDEPRSLGEAETGGRAALPIWIEFMGEALADRPDRPFARPGGITTAAVDPATGRRPDPRAACADPVLEVFLAGTEPSGYCTPADHHRARLPYPFQHYPADRNGSITLPAADLEWLLEQEPNTRFRRRRGLLEVLDEHGATRAPVAVVPGSGTLIDPAAEERFDTTTWLGTDGRRARVVWFDDLPAPRTSARSPRPAR